jgi:sugar phosphate isomerase/epimerase
MTPILSVNTLIFQGYDIPTIMKELSRLGVKHVELAFIKTYAPELKEEDFSQRNGQKVRVLLKDFGLSTVALSAHMDMGLADSVDCFKRRMAFAKEIGAGIVITNASGRSQETTFFRNMEKLALYAQSLQLAIGLENPGDGKNHIVDFAKTGALTVQRIGSDFVRLNYDIGNPFIYSKGKVRPEDDFEAAIPCSIHFHLKDVRLEETGYFYSEIGKGVIDYGMILKSLSKKAPAIPVGIEVPLCLKRGRDFIPWIDFKPVGLPEIERILKGSIEFIRNAWST